MYYIDIETVSGFKDYDSADDRTKQLFKTKFFREIEDEVEGGGVEREEAAFYLYQDKAAVLAEFNKIVCVSLGTIVKYGNLSEGARMQIDISNYPPAANANGIDVMYIKSLTGGIDAEKDILIALSKSLENSFELCAHFGKGFDYPVLCRKYVMHQIPIPRVLNISGLKPWEVPLHDTQDMWKFGDMRHSVSLDLLAHIFGLPSPKENMHGSEVSHYYYNEPDGLAQIVKYCEADVRTLINVHRKMNYLPILP